MDVTHTRCDNYYVDDIGWSAVAADACTGARTEAVVTVNDCSNITELTKGNVGSIS